MSWLSTPKTVLSAPLDLCRGVILRLQSADGRVDQFAQSGNIFRNSEAEADVRFASSFERRSLELNSIADWWRSATEFKLSRIMGGNVGRGKAANSCGWAAMRKRFLASVGCPALQARFSLRLQRTLFLEAIQLMRTHS